MSQVKQTLIDKMSKFQLGTKPGHRAQEHLFSVKSVISLYDSFGIPLILQLYDVSKFFDRESLRDGMNSVYHSGIRGKLYRLLFLLNSETKITV